MKTIKMVALPFTFLAAALMLGGCVGAEPFEGDEALDTQISAEQETAETATALKAPLPGESSAAYNGGCGSGYFVVNGGSLPVTGGTIYLTYNNSTGYNCVVTVRNTPGSRVQMCAKVSLAGQPWTDQGTDCGNYTTYAGPVYVHAPHTCIDWYGSIGNSVNYEFGKHCS
jgi:hypothetical protein